MVLFNNWIDSVRPNLQKYDQVWSAEKKKLWSNTFTVNVYNEVANSIICCGIIWGRVHVFWNRFQRVIHGRKFSGKLQFSYRTISVLSVLLLELRFWRETSAVKRRNYTSPTKRFIRLSNLACSAKNENQVQPSTICTAWERVSKKSLPRSSRKNNTGG